MVPYIALGSSKKFQTLRPIINMQNQYIKKKYDAYGAL